MAYRGMAIGILLALLISCGTQGTKPQVTAFYPQDGYHGFKRGEAISITFSEPMDAAATEAAFQLQGPGGAPVAVTFTWEDGGRRLRATPTDPIAYSPDDQYLNYRYLLSTGAKSRKGVALENGLDVTFSTMRTLTLVRDSVAALDGAVSAKGYVYNNPNDPSAYKAVRTGDTAANIAVRSFFAFSLNGLGLDSEDVAYARIRLYNTALRGAPFGVGNLGNLIAERVEYLEASSAENDETLALDADDFDDPDVFGSLPPLTAWTAGEEASLEVGDWLQDALAQDAGYLELRLRFETASDGDGVEDTVNPATGEDTGGQQPRLEIGYYAP